jgi:hypothetical protein
MTRLHAGGATIVSPYQSEEELKRVLCDLSLHQVLSPAAVHELYMNLGTIIGHWMAEQQRLEVSSVAGSLLSTAKSLNEASLILSGSETGLHSDLEIEVAGRIIRYLALVPRIGSPDAAQELISSFRQEADRIAHVCMVARADLPDQPAQSGRRALLWYDNFTALLLGLAKKAGIEPALRKDRITGLRSGWLFEAAQALEPFLWPEMRSPSPEACGTRLDRSKRRLRARHRQNRRAG